MTRLAFYNCAGFRVRNNILYPGIYIFHYFYAPLKSAAVFDIFWTYSKYVILYNGFFNISVNEENRLFSSKYSEYLTHESLTLYNIFYLYFYHVKLL